MIRVGLVGCGAIGSQLAKAIQKRFSRTARLVAVHDANPKAVAALSRSLRFSLPHVSLSELIRRSDLVVEAASASLVAKLVDKCLLSHRSILVMSVGGLLQNVSWKKKITRSRGKLYIPSGALAGLDGIKAMAIGRLNQASLTTRKPPKALAGAPYVRQKRLSLAQLKKPLVVFKGTPCQVVRYFPQNTNVAAALALATGLPDRKITVSVVADPSLKRNTHELRVLGDCGEIRCSIESVPSRNPKTSELAVRSAIAMLQRVVGQVQLGT